MGERTSYEPGTFSFAELATSDADGAKTFYGAVFGWEYEDNPLGDGVRERLDQRSAARSAASPISQNIGGHNPTNSARRSAFPRSSWSTVLARIHSARHRRMLPSEVPWRCAPRRPSRRRRSPTIG